MRKISQARSKEQSNVIPFPRWKTLPLIDLNDLLCNEPHMYLAIDPDGQYYEIRNEQNETIWHIRRVAGPS